MTAQTIYPLITVTALRESRDFFLRHFALAVAFEASWVVMLATGGTETIVLGLMSPDHPSAPPGPEAFSGQGMIVTVQVEDAAAMYATLTAAGAPIHYPLTDEPWGQRRFMTVDPSGILVDVVQQTDPAPGFSERSEARAAGDGAPSA
jgi:predicted enzyme related to lactoylglutathione lyase